MMGFFVVGRSTDGLLEMMGSREYETREDAARGIQTLALAGTIDVSGRDVYIVDMAGAAPVVIVGVAATPAPMPADEVPPAAGAWETTEEAAVFAGEQVEAAAVEAPSPDLAAALKRAATSLEDEGIVAPESIGAAAPTSEGEAATDEDLSEVIASLTMPTGKSATPDDEQAPAGETTQWPWANVGEVAANAEVDVDAADTPDDAGDDKLLTEALEAAVASDPGDDMLIVQSAAFGDDPFAPRAVIMGDYDETPVSPDDNVVVADDAPEAAIEADDAVATVAEEEPEAPAGGDAVAAVSEDTTGAIHEELPQIASLPGAYEISGDLELGTYTCEDCVYANTCPKVGQSTPDECGAFQWKAL